ncbi:hypothetical protein [Pseudomonas sp. PB101]|jgi:hypothetical protein|uniref:hypothetical protein n=1 Tax=Pseudomonas sp. PB101 TaxID=2495428 RepID=UPI0015B69F9A|nr:hypothetical protein [Pseudomonas sp. PB101]
MTTKSNAVATVSNPWERATLWINDKQVEWGAELVLLRGEENDVTVEAPLEIARTLKMGLVNSGGLNITASPVFDESVIPANGKFNWKITPGVGKSGRITLSFYNTDVFVPWEHRSLVISSNLADEAEVKIGGAVVPPGGNWFIRDKAQTVTLTPLPGSPLAGLPITLTCEVKSGLVDENVESAPNFGSEQTTYSWAVTGNTRSGIFQLSLSGKGMATPITLLNSTLLSNNLSDEATFLLGGATIPDEGAIFFGGDTKELKLTYKNGGFLSRAPLRLSMEPKSGLSPNDISSAPPLMQVVTAHNWLVTAAEAKWGAFDLVASFDDERAEIRSPTLQLMGDIRTELEFWFKGRLINPSGVHHPSRGGNSTLMLKLKPSSVIETLQVKVEIGRFPNGTVRMTPNFGVVQTVDSVTGASWTMFCGSDPRDHGIFSLLFKFIDPALPDLEMVCTVDEIG